MFTLQRSANPPKACPVKHCPCLSLMAGIGACSLYSHCQSINTLLCGPLLRRFEVKDTNIYSYRHMLWDCNQATRSGLGQVVCSVGAARWLLRRLHRGMGTEITPHFFQTAPLQQMIPSVPPYPPWAYSGALCRRFRSTLT